jgi:hypothetical protein
VNDRPLGPSLVDAQGQRYVLGDLIAEGGEGSIHEVPGQPDVVVKVPSFASAALRGEHAQELFDKLGVMLTRRPRTPAHLDGYAGHPFWAWPERPLHLADGSFAGYVMPRMRGIKGEEFHQFASGFDWAARIDAGRHLSALVVATHDAGYVIGDLNPRNLFFAPLGHATPGDTRPGSQVRVLPSIIDTDSFQINDPDTGALLFECRVQNPEYSAPELIDGVSKNRTRQQDAFTLAIVLFQILTLGVHPFSGVVKGSVNREIRSNIAKRKNVLLSADLQPPRGMVDLSVFPPLVRALFERTFGPGHVMTGARASALEWSELLGETLATGLVTCDRTERHVFGRHERRCPWCAYAAAVGADPFRPPPDGGSRRRRPASARVIQAGTGGGRPAAPAALPRRPSLVPPGPSGADDTIFGPVPTSLRSGPAAAASPPSSYAHPKSGTASDTIFGAIPMGTAAPSANQPTTVRPRATPDAPTLAPTAPAAAPASRAEAPAQTSAVPGPRGRPPTAPLIVIASVLLLGIAWFAIGPGGRDAVHGGVQRWLGQASLPGGARGGATEPVQVPIFTPPTGRGSHALTIELCVDRAPPYGCHAGTEPARGLDVVIMGSRRVERTASTTLPGMRVYLATDLPSDRYTITLIDTAGGDGLRRYDWCDGTSMGDVPLGEPIGIRLDRDRTLPLVLCAR